MGIMTPYRGLPMATGESLHSSGTVGLHPTNELTQPMNIHCQMALLACLSLLCPLYSFFSGPLETRVWCRGHEFGSIPLHQKGLGSVTVLFRRKEVEGLPGGDGLGVLVKVIKELALVLCLCRTCTMVQYPFHSARSSLSSALFLRQLACRP